MAVVEKVPLMGGEFELVRLSQRPGDLVLQVLRPRQWDTEEGIPDCSLRTKERRSGTPCVR